MLIKAALQAISMYVMSCFLLPNSLCKEMERISARFWWKKSAGRKGLHWCSWDSLCLPKGEEGVDFLDLAKFNIVLLAKQGWRLMENSNFLAFRLLYAKYYRGSTFLEASLRCYPSLIWRSIWCNKAQLQFKLGWRIGSGLLVSVWEDYWLRGKPCELVCLSKVNGLEKVSDLIILNTNCWDRRLIESTFFVDEGRKIVSIPLPTSIYLDKLVWTRENSGLYTVKSGYKTLLATSHLSETTIKFQNYLEIIITCQN